jgi:hypothetical protein
LIEVSQFVICDCAIEKLKHALVAPFVATQYGIEPRFAWTWRVAKDARSSSTTRASTTICRSFTRTSVIMSISVPVTPPNPGIRKNSISIWLRRTPTNYAAPNWRPSFASISAGTKSVASLTMGGPRRSGGRFARRARNICLRHFRSTTCGRSNSNRCPCRMQGRSNRQQQSTRARWISETADEGHSSRRARGWSRIS